MRKPLICLCRQLSIKAVQTVQQDASASVASPSGIDHVRSHETEVVVIGSGLGGLCCAAMLATYGVKVCYPYSRVISLTEPFTLYS